MTRLQHIAVIADTYPTRLHLYQGAFLRQLVHAFAEQEVRCTVIHPWKLHQWLRDRRQAFCDEDVEVEGVRVCRPLTLSASNRHLGVFNTFAFTQASFQRAVWRVLRRLPEKPGAVYGHFMYPAGAAAVWAGRRLGRAAFVAVGEDLGETVFWSLQPLGIKRARLDLTPATGMIAVSSLHRQRLIDQLGFPTEKVAVFPNAVDFRKFHPRDRSAMRRKYGLPEDQFLVIYVGNFIERKGVRRAVAAIDSLPGVAGVFVGSGPIAPQAKNVAFCGVVPHELVPELLSAADCFLLPSEVEGSSNATLEAMACGLPVVVSVRPFNQEICDQDSAWLVEPDHVSAIRKAIVSLQSNSALRQRMAKAALARAAHFDIQIRAQRILGWMAHQMGLDPQPPLPERANLAAVISIWTPPGGSVKHI